MRYFYITIYILQYKSIKCNKKMQVMQTFFSSFNLPNFPTQKIITGDFGCKGSGKTLGFTDGTNYGGSYKSQMSNLSCSATMLLSKSDYGNNIGQTVSAHDRTWGSSLLTMGITTDTSKSGIITDTSGFTSVNVCIKF